MQRINVSQFYQLGQWLHPLTELEPGKRLKDYFYTFIMANWWIDNFLKDQMIPMTICKPAAQRITRGISALTDKENADQEEELNYSHLYNIIEGAKEFEAVFFAEVQNMATYFVSKKAIYDTNDLILRADDLFTGSVRESISERARIDIREAGRSLAFDLATAAGFHISRAVERVLVDYLTLKCPKEIRSMKESQRNLGQYIKLAREKGCGEKICSSLDQFRDLHRNPLMHPESVLDMDEAIILLGIAQSSIVAMAVEMEKIKTPRPKKPQIKATTSSISHT